MDQTPIRLLISDIDGTLVRRDKGLPEANVVAIKDLTARGLKVSLISARPAAGMLPIAAELGLELAGPDGLQHVRCRHHALEAAVLVHHQSQAQRVRLEAL